MLAGFAILGTTEPDFYRRSATGIPRNKLLDTKLILNSPQVVRIKSTLLTPGFKSATAHFIFNDFIKR